MVVQGSVQELLKTLSKEDKKSVQDFIDKIEGDVIFLQNSCVYLADKIGDPGLVDEFEKMSENVKKTACIEYLIFALNSGSIEMKEIVEIAK